MKRLLLTFTIACLACLSLCGAKAYRVGDVPNVHLRDARLRVSDPEGLLSSAARDSVNAMLQTLDRQTGIEVAVVMLPSIEGGDPFTFAHELFRAWGIGSSRTSNGLLFLYVDDIHRIRITVGDGLEGTMTDAMSRRIIERHMIPHFRQGDHDAGMVEGVRAACSVLDGTMQPEEPVGEGLGLAFIVIGLGVIVLAIVLSRQLSRAARKCPHCGHPTLRRTDTEHFRRSGARFVTETFVCDHCGHTTRRTRRDDDQHIGMGPVIGGMGGGSIGRGGSFGGFSGGSWGGGTTSGGGATGGW